MHLPNNVNFNILLHCIANERSELSKIVIRSPSEMKLRYKFVMTSENICNQLSHNRTRHYCTNLESCKKKSFEI